MQGTGMGSAGGLDQAVENQSISVNAQNYNSELRQRLGDPCGKYHRVTLL